MRTLAVFQKLGPIDLKNVRRDPLLIWVPILPLFMALCLRVLVPPINDLLQAQIRFALWPYYPLVMGGFALMVPAIVGMVIGFLLLDERDDRTLMALLVTPLPLRGYLLYRMVLPMIIGTIATFVSYPLVGLIPISWGGLLAGALVGSLLGPQIALFLAAFAENKVAGLAMLKLLNTVLLLPLVAFFIAEPWQLIAGIIPAYWPLKFFWLAATGTLSWQTFLIGLIYNMIVVLLLLKRFTTVVHR